MLLVTGTYTNVRTVTARAQSMGTASSVDSRPQSEVQDEGGSFLLLPWQQTLPLPEAVNWRHSSSENSLKEVQGVAAGSHILSTLLKDLWPCVQHLGVECHAPLQ